MPKHLPNLSIFATRSRRQIAATSTALFIAFIAIGSVAAQSPSAGAADPTGQWRTAKGYAIIRIVNCDGRLWGVVAWETYPSVDSKNPDPDKRSRPTLGMPILLGMTQSKENQWSGKIYNSQDGHTYSASINLIKPDVLRVQGCMFGFLCGGENWTRVQTSEASPTASPNRGQRSKSTRSTNPQGQARRSTNSLGASNPQGQSARPNTQGQPGTEQTSSDADICLRVDGGSGLSHERGLK